MPKYHSDEYLIVKNTNCPHIICIQWLHLSKLKELQINFSVHLLCIVKRIVVHNLLHMSYTVAFI